MCTEAAKADRERGERGFPRPAHVLVVGITVFWMTMMGLLYRRQAARKDAEPLAPSYERLLPPGVDRVERTMGIYMIRRRFGTAHTVIQRHQDGIRVENVIEINVERIPKYVRPMEQDVVIHFGLDFSPLTGLRSVRIQVPEFDVGILGWVQEGEIALTGRIGEQRISERLPFNQGTLFSDLFSPLEGLPKLSRADVGRKWTVTLINPLTGSPEAVTVEVKRLIREWVSGEERPVFVLEFSTHSSLWNTWVTSEGEVLQQGTPFGLVLKREDVPFLEAGAESP